MKMLKHLRRLGEIMETLFDDPRFWDALDNLVNSSWRETKEMCDLMGEYTGEIPPQLNALILGGLGTFVRSYAIARSESNPPPLSFQLALRKVNENPLVQGLVQQTANDMVDGKVNKMKEVNE